MQHTNRIALISLICIFSFQALPAQQPSLHAFKTPRLLQILEGRNKERRYQALRILLKRKVQHPQINSALLRALEREYYQIDREIIHAIIERGEELAGAYSGLKKLAATKYNQRRRIDAATAIFAVSKNPARRREGLARLKKEWDNPETPRHIRFHLSYSLARAGKKAIPALLPMLKQGNASRKMMVVSVLSRIAEKHEAALPGLVSPLGDPDMQVSRRAAQRLYYLGPKVIPYLLPELKANELYRRVVAADIIGAYAPEHLKHLRNSPHPLLRRLARRPVSVEERRKIQGFGFGKKTALELLQKLQKAENFMERNQLINAIEQKGQKGVPVLYLALREIRSGWEGEYLYRALKRKEGSRTALIRKLFSMLKKDDPILHRGLFLCLSAAGSWPALKIKEDSHHQFVSKGFQRSLELFQKGKLISRVEAGYFLLQHREFAAQTPGKSFIKRLNRAMKRAYRSPHRSLRLPAGVYLAKYRKSRGSGTTRELLKATFKPNRNGLKWARKILKKTATARKKRLFQLLNDSDPAVRNEAIYWLTQIKTKNRRALQKIRKLLRHKDPSTRAFAAVSLLKLKRLNPKKHYPLLIESFQIGMVWITTNVWAALEKMDSKDLPLLTRGLRSPNLDVRIRTAWLLERIGPRAALLMPELLKLAGAKDWLLREHVARAVRAMDPGSPPLIKQLTAMLDSSDPLVVADALDILGNYGPRSRTALPRILSLIKKNRLRRAAAGALSKIAPRHPELKNQGSALYEHSLRLYTQSDHVRLWKLIRSGLK